MNEPHRPAGEPPAPSVLIVPHCSECGTGLQLLLSLMGYQAEVVRGGAAAVQRARALGPRAALVDLHLPDEDGLEVGCQLREALGDRVLLVGLTPAGSGADEARAEAVPFDHWLWKPVDPTELARLLPAVGPASHGARPG
jgi:DNA-binding response OmpR family regulator